MYKKVLFQFSLVACICAGIFLAGCDDKDPVDSAFSVEDLGSLIQTNLPADAETGTSISFTTTGAWTSSITETTTKSSSSVSWLNIEPSSGAAAGEYNVSLNLTKNYTGEDRSAEIVFTCNGETITINVTQKATTSDGTTLEPDVYYAGFEWEGTSNRVVKLWKNGVVQNITDGTYNARAFSLYVSNGDAYIGGYVTIGNNNIATYWKNGVEHRVTEPQRRTEISSIFVSGDDVYKAGSEDVLINNVWQYLPRLWKNGEEQNLETNNEANRTFAQSVSVSANGDVYVAGYESQMRWVDSLGYNVNYNSAKFWRNGVLQNLNVPANRQSDAFYVYTTGSDVYVVGNVQGEEGFWIPHLWKNGVVQNLQMFPNGRATATSVTVSGTDVYVVGYGSDDTVPQAAILWKNGVPQLVSNKDGIASPQHQAWSVAAFGNNVYVGGFQLGAPQVGKVWINGVENILTDTGANSMAQIRGVFVDK